MPAQIPTGEHHPRRIGWLDGIPRQQEALLQFPGVEILQTDRQRTVLRIPPSPSRPTLIAKIHQEQDLAARCRRFLGWGRARLEWINLRRAEDGGASVPRPVALVRNQDHDIVFIDYLLDTETYPQQLESYSGDQRVAMLRVLGKWVAEIVRAGIDAHDLHTGNILVRGIDPANVSLFLIDLHDARVGFGVPPHRRRAMVRQVASALGAARADGDVRHFLQGWAHGARILGVDGTWASGPDQETDGVGWAEVKAELLAETLRKAERSEILRRRRHISRAFRKPQWSRRSRKGVESVFHNKIDATGPFQVRRARRRSGWVRWFRALPTEARAAWLGDRVRKTIWRFPPRAILFVERDRGRHGGEELIVEKSAGKTPLDSFLSQSPGLVSELMEPVLSVLHRYHREGIHFGGMTAGHWYVDEGRNGFVVNPDPAFIRYQGELTREHIIEDLIGLGAIFDGTLTVRDRYRGLRSYPGFSSLLLSSATIGSLGDRLGQRFAGARVARSPVIQIRPAHDQDVAALHLLNEANAPEVGSLGRVQFKSLLQVASMVRVVDSLGD
ncbi:MAG: lipopolysaccharide kinase InaA family protein, partial [Planctomycetota bacterium]